ncbi:hypothetical protein CUJ83_09500 [Methanocella sp. CWC-04]|uniref:TM2 domain-containing membrane protein YozV n=2 Tax=Methanooceanicella nereidis TaxID=2052831 RepID=A0AAP2RFF2_9EURY|nr:hypothetical protein [Methanocella sp. CWC-04]
MAAPSPAGIKIKEPLLALILSFFLPGLGQIYNGQIKKGIIAIIGYAVVIFAMIVLSFFIIGICLIPVIFIVWLWGMYDAYTTANKINRGEPVTDWLS